MDCVHTSNVLRLLGFDVSYQLLGHKGDLVKADNQQ